MKRKLIIAAAVVMSCAGLMAQPTAWSEPQLLIKAEQSLMAPVWSPDGSKIAATGDNFIGIWVANADGSSSNKFQKHLAQATKCAGTTFKKSCAHLTASRTKSA